MSTNEIGHQHHRLCHHGIKQYYINHGIIFKFFFKYDNDMDYNYNLHLVSFKSLASCLN